jgi:hypothetical protein
MLVVLPLLAALAAVGASLLRGPQFVSQSRFSPEGGKSAPVRLGPLAAQFGLDAALGGEPGESLPFYAVVLRSHDLQPECRRGGEARCARDSRGYSGEG